MVDKRLIKSNRSVSQANAEAESAPMLWGDETRLKQVLINLVKNALKFTRRGTIVAELSYDSEEGILYGSVLDSGQGIEAEDLPKLFSRFGKLQRTA